MLLCSQMEELDEDMCDECRDHPWHSREWEVFTLRQTVDQLRASTCRICRLLGLACSDDPSIMQSEIHLVVDYRMDEPDNSFCLMGNPGYVCGFVNLQKTAAWENRSTLIEAMRLVDFNKLRGWLQRCLADHVHQDSETASSIANLRVIDCHHDGKAVITAPIECDYVALSYVWGAPDPNNLEHGMEFPPTVMDAMLATRMLGYRYLWVDRYCIDQNDENDQHNQINQMDLIYSRAKVTLIAAAGKDPSYGLPGVSRNSIEKVHTEPLNDNWTLQTETRPISYCIISSSWFHRAWTLQEGVLSKRKLCFTDYGVLFLCNSNTTGTTCVEHESLKDRTKEDEECFGMDTVINALSPNRILGAHNLEGKLSNVKDLMHIYSKRDLTFESDSLNALLGAFNFMRKSDPPVYHIWGMAFTTGGRPSFLDASNEVMISLDWFPRRIIDRRPEFPSWSTLGWRGAIAYRDGHSIKLSQDFSIRYWDLGSYRNLDETFRDPEYSIRAGEIPQSQVLEITAHVMELTVYEQKDPEATSHYVKLPFIKLMLDTVRQEFQTDIPVDEAMAIPRWNDCHGFSHSPTILCCTSRYLGVVQEDFGNEVHSHVFLLFFKKTGDHYERVGMWSPNTQVYLGIDLKYDRKSFDFEDGFKHGWIKVDLEAYLEAFAEKRTFYVR